MSERGSGLGDYRLGRRQFLAGSALASAALLLAGCRQEAAQQASQGGGGGSGGNFPDTPEYNFVFVNSLCLLHTHADTTVPPHPLPCR
jgi:simple sugar transport system substrate-binding protein